CWSGQLYVKTTARVLSYVFYRMIYRARSPPYPLQQPTQGSSHHRTLHPPILPSIHACPFLLFLRFVQKLFLLAESGVVLTLNTQIEGKPSTLVRWLVGSRRKPNTRCQECFVLATAPGALRA